MNQSEVLKMFEEHKALLTGHFRLSSGLHSDRYLQCALVLQYPDIAEKMAKTLAGKFSGERIEVVIGPALGGITLAYEVARMLGVRALFTEREAARMILRRGFFINPGERSLVVEDVVTTGGSTKEVIEVVKNSGGTVVGAASIIDRSSGRANLGVRYEALATLDVSSYEEKACPLCKKNIPVTKPGSRT